jgi:hypothetical protein
MSEMLLRRYTTDENIASEVLRYAQNVFEKRGVVSVDEIVDEPFTEAFRQIVLLADSFGAQYALDTLFRDRSVKLSAPALTELYIHNSFAGNIPVIFTESVEDFEKLVCELGYKGVFSEHIKNMGASFLYGKNRAFIILSNKPYSNVPSAELGLDEAAWRRYSTAIRREHECLHYYTRKFYGGTRNHLHEELIADFVGIVSATGTYKAEWFLKFLGIDRDAAAKKRYDIYIEGLSAGAASVMKGVTAAAAYSLEKYCKSRRTVDLPEAINFLCGHDILELSCDGVP